MWTLQGVQNLIDQQNKILSEFKCKLETPELVSRSEDEMTYLTIPRPRIVRRVKESRKQEMDSLRQFQERMEEKLERCEKVLFEVCDL